MTHSETAVVRAAAMSDPLAARAALRENLRTVAALGETLTYHQAARGVGLRPPHVIHSVTCLIEALMAEDAEHGHPFIAALVVSRARDGLPALGFFETAARLGRFDGDPFGPEALAYHAAELALATAFHSSS
jgi:hypothetical protein